MDSNETFFNFNDTGFYKRIRYSNVKLIDKTRVRLKAGIAGTPMEDMEVCLKHTEIPKVKWGKNNDEAYIHANFVSDINNNPKFILTQAPLNNGDKNTVGDFYQMIFENDVEYIICLAKNKIEQYWPDEGITKNYHYNPVSSTTGITFPLAAYFKVKISGVDLGLSNCACAELSINKYTRVDENSDKDNIIRTLGGNFIESGTKTVILIQYKAWPDHYVPDSVTDIIELIKTMQKVTGKILIHCSAGIGRSGTLVACYNTYNLPKNVRSREAVDFIIKKIRSERHGAIETDSQKSFVELFL